MALAGESLETSNKGSLLQPTVSVENIEEPIDAGNEDLTGDSALEPSIYEEPTFREEKASPK